MTEWTTLVSLLFSMLANGALFGFIGYRLGRLEAKAQSDRDRADTLQRRVELTDQRVDILREEMKLELRGQR